MNIIIICILAQDRFLSMPLKLIDMVDYSNNIVIAYSNFYNAKYYSIISIVSLFLPFKMPSIFLNKSLGI